MASAVLVLTVGRFVRVLVDRFVWFAIFAALLVVVAMATLSIDDVFEWLSLAGKDATMSSRLPLWQSLQPFLADRFWLGHGYESFWGDGSPMMGVIESRVFFKPHYAHNGYIELWLGLGAVGFGLMAALFIRFGVTAVRRLYDDDRDPSMLLALVYVPMFLIQNMAEVTILQRNSMNWILFVWLYLVMVLPRPDRQTADRVHPAEVRMAEIDRRLLVH
jgi:O-antigen ligase